LARALPRPADEHLLPGLASGLGLASMTSLGLAAAGALRPVPLALAGATALALGGPALGRALGAVRVPRGRLAWMLIALSAPALATLVRRHLDRRLGVMAGALFFTMPMCWSQLTRAGADMSVVLYGALAVAAWLDWAAGLRGSDLRRAAILAGLAGGSKIMGLL